MDTRESPQALKIGEGPVRLSSGMTTFWSKVFPPAWTTVFGASVFAAWFDALGAAPEPLKIALLVIWAAVSLFLFRWLGRLRQVWLDGDELVVGDRLRGHRIGLRHVTHVKESWAQNLKCITIDLDHMSAVGRRVTFVARGAKAWLFPWAPSRVATDLRGRIAAPERAASLPGSDKKSGLLQ